MLRFALMLAAATAAPLPALALSNAANYLVAQEIGLACGGSPGRYDPDYVVERDLDGDGRSDLVISHEGIECQTTGRSAECGMMLCSIRVWVRRGDLLALAVDDLIGYNMTVGDGPTPEIRWVAENGAPVAMRWDGSGFR